MDENIVANPSENKMKIDLGASEPAVADCGVQPSWRKVTPPHPLAEMPPLPPAELKDLVDDIAQYGIRNDVTVYRDEAGHLVLDGCNRLDAAELAGLPIIKDGTLNPDVVPIRWVAGNTNLKKFVHAQNILRRHLTTEGKHHWAKKLLKDDPGQSDRAIAREVGADHKTVAGERRRLEACGEIPRTETRTDTGGRRQPARRTKVSANGSGRNLDHDAGDHHDEHVGHVDDDHDRGDHHDHDGEDRTHIQPTEPATPVPSARADDPIANINKILSALSDDALIEVMRPQIVRLGREGLCRAIPDELKAEFSDHIIGQGLCTASTRSTFAKASSQRLHCLLRCAEEPSDENVGKMVGAAKAIIRDAKNHDITRSQILIAEGGAKGKKKHNKRK